MQEIPYQTFKQRVSINNIWSMNLHSSFRWSCFEDFRSKDGSLDNEWRRFHSPVNDSRYVITLKRAGSTNNEWKVECCIPYASHRFSRLTPRCVAKVWSICVSRENILALQRNTNTLCAPSSLLQQRTQRCNVSLPVRLSMYTNSQIMEQMSASHK